MQDKPVALVTGANKGIGLHIAKDLTTLPWKPSAHYVPAPFPVQGSRSMRSRPFRTQVQCAQLRTRYSRGRVSREPCLESPPQSFVHPPIRSGTPGQRRIVSITRLRLVSAPSKPWSVYKQSMIFRLHDTDRAAFLELGGTGDFEPMPGRKMKGYMIMAEPLDRERSILAQWMRRSLAFTRALPPKAKKAASARKTKQAKR